MANQGEGNTGIDEGGRLDVQIDIGEVVNKGIEDAPKVYDGLVDVISDVLGRDN